MLYLVEKRSESGNVISDTENGDMIEIDDDYLEVGDTIIILQKHDNRIKR